MNSIVIIGLGRIGSKSAKLIVKHYNKKSELILIDRDIIEKDNLKEQPIYNSKDLFKPKVIALKQKLKNPKIKLISFFKDLNSQNIKQLIPKKTKIILDCTDNLKTRFLLNEYSVKEKIPLIYSAGLKNSGNIMLFNPNKQNACFNCLIPKIIDLPSCELLGISNQTSSLIALLQVNETIKYLNKEKNFLGLIDFDLKEKKISFLKVKKRNDCKVCIKKEFDFLNGKRKEKIISFCGNNSFQFKTRKSFNQLKKELKTLNDFKDLNYVLKLKDLIVFKDKRVLVKANNLKQAKTKFNKFIGEIN